MWDRCAQRQYGGKCRGQFLFADLVSVAGHIYKHGINAGLPGGKEGKPLINLHCDEFTS